ncbi:L,D-transpeptidase family protein [Paenibacillus sp. y28]|uniref:L,D-transpeptidase family protein n=1 Tax=Paenibacillus sp. y28 TaxID=3129110 RepID=UPI00301767D3
MGDSQYLKAFVQAHPDNKMAWYLLGREYMAKGEAGKARYCFLQAGEVYTAYEDIVLKAPQVSPEELKQALPVTPAARRKRPIRTIALALMLLSLLALAPYMMKEGTVPRDQAAQENAAAGLQPETAVSSPLLPAGTGVYYVVPETAGAGGSTKEQALQALMLPKQQAFSFAVLAQARPSGDARWLDWSKEPLALLSAERKGTAGGMSVNYHDAGTCLCEPSDSSGAKQTLAVWKQQQEQQIVLRTALEGYMRSSGRLPETIGELSQSYPNNTLSGYTPGMEAAFEPLKAQLIAASQGAAPSPSTGGSPAGQAGSGGQQPSPLTNAASLAQAGSLVEPLQIVVDKDKHRLALVSGSLIIRSYPVGLGADRTPEGEFYISEKVKNPNGKTNGDFGSRGMTLSDTLYAIHGTNRPDSIGKDQSLGCIRMLNKDVEELFAMTPKQAKVTIGRGLLPGDGTASGEPFTLPSAGSDETNPGKTYKWLN